MTAKRTKAALSQKGLLPRAERIWFLTGTPVKNRTIDLYPILRSCAPEVLGPYKSYLKFAYRYCGAYTGRFGLDTSGASHTEELCERLKGFMLRREKRDVLTELPPRVISKIDLECTPAVKKVIESEEQATIEKAGDSDPANFKLGEIARVRKAIAKHKVPISVEYIKDLLEEEDKIVVFYYHKEVLGELRRAFASVPHVFIDGSVDPSRRKGLVAEFTNGKNHRLFFGQMEACGEGIDGLQDACSCCVFVEPSWSHTDLEQCIGRLERSGQRSDINVHILTIKDTLEARMMEVVAMKLNVDKKLYNQKKGKRWQNPTKKHKPHKTSSTV
jgi:SNF2 family DNA or RNA helicase